MTKFKTIFPKDHCFHKNDNEWIYFSGTVKTREGKEFGLMFTIFQYSVDGSRFSYPAMVGISDPVTSRFYDAQTYVGNTAATITPEGLPSIKTGKSSLTWNSLENLHIVSSMNSGNTILFIDMDMKPTMDILHHGEDGYILMGDGIPSGYYSFTNLLPTKGILRINDQQYNIIGGRIWMDHQWGDWTGAGYNWDWFSLRFDNGGALMLFQFRDFYDKPLMGNWTYRNQYGEIYYGIDFKVTAKRKFKSYPLDWVVEITSIDAKINVSPLFDDQTFTGLWEGLCDVNGIVGTSQVTGQAFVELSGY